jgi:hypothetical protein
MRRHQMKHNLLNSFALGYASRALSSNSNLVILTSVLAATACFPPPMADAGDSTDSETGVDSGREDLPGDGDGEPGDGDCVAELPHDWGEGLVDIWMHSCEITGGTFVECCVAVWVQPEHQGVVTPYSASGSNWWGVPPLFADAGELVGPWWSDGDTRFGRVTWDHCGLPKDEFDPATRVLELRALDYSLGATASDSVSMGAGSIVCPDEVPCEGATSLECDDSGCWASSDGWTAAAQTIDQAAIDQAVNGGLWEPAELAVGDECWTIVGSDAHICIVDSCGAKLLGRPADELNLDIAGPGCSYTGSWSATASSLGMCLGMIDGLAVQLRP